MAPGKAACSLGAETVVCHAVCRHPLVCGNSGAIQRQMSHVLGLGTLSLLVRGCSLEGSQVMTGLAAYGAFKRRNMESLKRNVFMAPTNVLLF